ncbi:uncharacterized protein [Elaeis guineensis]|uniref:Uncharacterized protein LOC105059470 n=1 Tax=Elaeis guineensis var. tenera TaxID=51953 RepID=A0A6I9SD71_ELAGV|nr:uncharacterized protein LOC105059470 [Elaeis guineensis]
MGITPSILAKLGVPGVESLAQDQVYDKYFKDKDITDFEKFHLAFIDLCNDINTVLPGKHYKAPPRKVLENIFKTWKDSEESKRKEVLMDNFKKEVEEHKPNERAMIVTGLVAPAAATYLKRTGENTPQLKKFRLHLIPNFVFVPTTTFLALVGVRVLQIKATTRS